MKVKQCVACFEFYEGKRAICNKCHSEREKLRQIIKRAENSPQNYLVCNNCDRIFYKYKYPKTSFVKNIELIICRFCNSIDIEGY